MNRTVTLISIFIISLFAFAIFIERELGSDYDIEDLEERVNIQWNYGYSSNVIYGEILKNRLVESNDKQCSFHVSDVRVIESFKGEYNVGDIFTTTGITIHETTDENSEHLLFLNDLKVRDFPGFGTCNEQDFIQFKSIHNWCCSVVGGETSKQLLMYDMINSETSSQRYTVDAEIAFTELRKLKTKGSAGE